MLLRMRPDAMAAPQPLTLGELAGRLALPHGVMSALNGVDRPSFQVLEALAALGDGAPRAEVRALLAGEGDDESAGFAAVLTGLFRRGLAWPEGASPEGEVLRLAEPLRDWPVGAGPLGLGPPAAALLPQLTADVLRRITRELGVPVTGRRKDELVAEALRVLGDRDRVRAVVAAAPQAVRALLDKAARRGTADLYQRIYFPQRARDDDPYGWAVAHGLLIQLDWLPPVMPAEVALALRGPAYRVPFTPDEPVPATLPSPPHSVAAEFGAVASRAVEEVTRLIALCEKEPPVRRKSGGVGVRELRRVAKAAGCTEDAGRLWLELAAAADLVDWHDAGLVPTAAFDTWQTDEPAERLICLVRWWRQLTRLPLLEHPDDGLSAPLQGGADDPAAPRLRAAVFEVLAALPHDAGAARAEALTEPVMWRRPLLFEDAGLAPPYLAAVWREAELLGLLAHGALTPAGRALLGDSADDAAEDAAGFERVVAAALAPACTTVMVQSDLTAVVPGPPSAYLAELLDGLADRETHGTASTWRFSPVSIRRALDAGRAAGEIVSELRAVSESDLPQPLEYLVNDVARRHGEVTVTPVACAICCPRPALLNEIRAHRRLRGLGLRELAPTVLASAKPMTETLRALRDAGYAPAGHDAAGTPVIERTPRRRAAPSPPGRPVRPHAAKKPAARRASPGYSPEELAERLYGIPAEPPAQAGADKTADALAGIASQLSATERRLLAHALDTGEAVRIDYVSADGNASSRVIENAELDEPFLTAWCLLRNDQRVFHIGRITAVAPAT